MYKNHSLAAGATQGYASYTHRYGVLKKERMLKVLKHVAIPISLGALIYISFRPTNLTVFEWLDRVQLLPLAITIREFIGSNVRFLPDWIKYCFPDALWTYSFTAALAIGVNNGLSKTRLSMYLLLPIGLGVFSEIAQLIGCLSGTYDNMDILSYTLGGLFAYTLLNKKLFIFKLNNKLT